MKHIFRFFGHQRGDQTWELDPEEVHHFSKVLRLQSGTEVEVTDGAGRWARGLIDISNSRASVSQPTNHVEPQPTQLLSIAIGALKPSTMEEVVPSLVELGADRITSFLQPGTEKRRHSEKNLQRLLKVAKAAVKQSKRCWIPQLHQTESLELILTEHEGWDSFFASPDQTAAKISPSSNHLLLVIGGEAGITEEETERLVQAGFVGLALGTHILRAKTAAIAGTAVLNLSRTP